MALLFRYNAMLRSKVRSSSENCLHPFIWLLPVIFLPLLRFSFHLFLHLQIAIRIPFFAQRSFLCIALLYALEPGQSLLFDDMSTKSLGSMFLHREIRAEIVERMRIQI